MFACSVPAARLRRYQRCDEGRSAEQNPVTGQAWIFVEDRATHDRHYRADEWNLYETNGKRRAESRFFGEAKTAIDMEGRKLEFRSTTEVRTDEKNFYVTITRYLTRDGELLHQREWSETIPRMFN